MESARKTDPEDPDEWRPAPLIELFHQYSNEYKTSWSDFYYETPVVIILHSIKLLDHRSGNGVLNWAEISGAKSYLRGKGQKFGKKEKNQADAKSSPPTTAEERDPNSPFYLPVYDASTVKVLPPADPSKQKESP